MRTLPASVGGFQPGSLGGCVLRSQAYEHHHPPNGRLTRNKSGLLYLNASDVAPILYVNICEKLATSNGYSVNRMETGNV